jgi:hypothetical protein
MKRIGDRVKTKYGTGTIKATEGPYGTYSAPWYTYGVLHDTFPADVPRMFTDNIMYFMERELETGETPAEPHADG